ncbi:hypothetical protein QUA54_11705 [Microcoleus sp. MOSTC5]|uniref:hypothetical protein n=1 Tax=Microcoleus sp. MOSTC5 TaxID=3055378 RepID=UPI002FCF20E7
MSSYFLQNIIAVSSGGGHGNAVSLRILGASALLWGRTRQCRFPTDIGGFGITPGADTAMPFPYRYWGLRHYSGGGHGIAVSLWILGASALLRGRTRHCRFPTMMLIPAEISIAQFG